jgi:hypothetical protein
MARNRQGVTTSPSIEELKAFAQLIVSNVRADMGANRINRLAVTFARNMPTADGYTFFLYVTNAVQMSEDQKRAALLNPDVARVIAYRDEVGETAVNRVLRERGF